MTEDRLGARPRLLTTLDYWSMMNRRLASPNLSVEYIQGQRP